ncbi:MAG: PLA2G4F protein [candidate division TM6 bacterium GW2011_GWF2_36_6]|nr:MAG: PLA2G4F protein [candidate division TM6 bacterium GW2011_GWF2_36_6]
MAINTKSLAIHCLILHAFCYCMEPVVVDCSNQLDPREKEYQLRRSQITQPAIKQLIGLAQEADYRLPKINICFSGGGVRAETAAIGFLAGAEQIGLLQSTNNIAALSGSTWGIIPWILYRMPPIEYAQILKQQLQINFWSSIAKNEPRINVSLQNLDFNACLVTEIWGHLIARRLLDDLEQKYQHPLTYQDFRDVLAQTNIYPFPIFTTAIGQTGPFYEGLEVTPFSVYSSHLRAGMRTELFGSIIANGYCRKLAPEMMLWKFMGAFGSAFSLTEGDLVTNGFMTIFDELGIENFYFRYIEPQINIYLKKHNYYKHRCFDYAIPNFTMGMEPCGMNDLPTIDLIDHGIYINIPIFPFNRPERQSDVFVICDASSDASAQDHTELVKSQLFAKAHGMPFPSLGRFKVTSKGLKIFYEDNPEIPIVIYVVNPTQISMFKMTYDASTFDSVYQPMSQILCEPENKNAIVEAIKFKTSQLNNGQIPNKFGMLKDGKVTSGWCTLL